MTSILFANLWRRPGRTAFTALGIALGVATIVGLLSLGEGLKQTAGQLVRLGQADFAVLQHGVEDPSASFLPQSVVDRVGKIDGVASATPVMLLADRLPDAPGSLVFGTTPKGKVSTRLVVVSGRRMEGPGEIAVGDLLAEQLGVKTGDTMTIDKRKLEVVGTFHAGQFFVDGGAIIDVKLAQNMVQRPGEVTTIAVQVAADAHTKDVRKEILADVPGTDVISNPDEAARAGANGRLIRKTVLLLVAVALIIGGIGVANTMAMAVLERSRELALMSAVGWSPRQVSGIVLLEGVVVSVIGAGVGLLAGALGAGALGDALDVASVVKPSVTPWSIGRGLIIGVVIGVLGGLYPAWRVSRLPAEELLARGA
ncbi:MAG: ABC transporter permease [Solirubrobacteraceae bacterium]